MEEIPEISTQNMIKSCAVLQTDVRTLLSQSPPLNHAFFSRLLIGRNAAFNLTSCRLLRCHC